MKGEYGLSEQGNFKVVDTIGVPHPYCITPKHVEIASQWHGGILDESAIRHAEERGAKCGVKGCNLNYDQHEQALLVGCSKEIKNYEASRWSVRRMVTSASPSRKGSKHDQCKDTATD